MRSRLTARTYGLRRFAALMNFVAYFRIKGYHVGRVESFATVGTRPGRLDPASLNASKETIIFGVQSAT
jgi:hypothetical protein